MTRSIGISALLLLLACPSFGAVPAKPSQAELREMMTKAFAEAEEIPAQERLPYEREIVMTRFADREEWIRSSLLAIALRPRDARPAFNLIAAVSRNREPGVYVVNEEETAADRAAAKAFLFDLYRSRAGKSAEGLGWQAGLAELLLFEGKFEEALKLDRETLPLIDEPQYLSVRLAMLELLTGNPAPFRKAIAECEGPPAEYAQMTDNYCATVARSIATRAKDSLGRKAPAAIDDILAGRAGMDVLPWNERMHGLVSLASRNFELAKKDLREVLANPDAPAYAKNDAILLLARLVGNSHDHKEELALIDCWIARRKVVFPEFPEDGWQQLASRELARKGTPRTAGHGEACMDHDFGEERPVDEDCMISILFRRLFPAMGTKDWPVARQTIERTAAVVLASDRDGGIVDLMIELYLDWTHTVLRKEAAVVARYAENAGFEQALQRHTDLLREQTGRVTEPWKSPTKVNAPPAACP